MWITKVTTMVCLSTSEADFVVAVHATKYALWTTNMIAEIRSISVPVITVLEDNQTCIKMVSNPVVSTRNRHFAMHM